MATFKTSIVIVHKSQVLPNVVVNKLNNNLDVIRKVEDYIRHLVDVLNKTRLFDEGLAKNSVIAAKVIPILVDFNQKIKDLLIDM